ncbi:hypothetical protein Ga0080559_TMP4521 [Salipiger profundus]|uniref:Uncharacterized protein n=1 Tax=Salipiger profundus TaxID=1229727 RepID=A0A1U7DAW5_9RHOB|nr:hypothetical protein Ga0080559_TMP4521 [Salipiger profundus]
MHWAVLPFSPWSQYTLMTGGILDQWCKRRGTPPPLPFRP